MDDQHRRTVTRLRILHAPERRVDHRRLDRRPVAPDRAADRAGSARSREARTPPPRRRWMHARACVKHPPPASRSPSEQIRLRTTRRSARRAWSRAAARAENPHSRYVRVRMPSGISPPSFETAMQTSPTAAVDLFWIPLGAGGHSVRFNGRVFEALEAARRHRQRCDLYHAALVVELDGDRYAIELAPSPNADEASRGVLATGAVGSRHARLAAPVSLRGPLLARRIDPGSRRGGRRAPPAQQRSAVARRLLDLVTDRAHAGLGTRRAQGRRDVELELHDRVADRHRRSVDRPPPAATARSRSGLGRRSRGGSTQRRVRACVPRLGNPPLAAAA